MIGIPCRILNSLRSKGLFGSAVREMEGGFVCLTFMPAAFSRIHPAEDWALLARLKLAVRVLLDTIQPQRAGRFDC